MKRKLDFSQVLKTFEGKPMHHEKFNPKEEDRKFTLKDGLITYIRNANVMPGLDENDRNVAYIIGLLIGQSKGSEILTTEQYNVLKKLADNGKISRLQSEPESIYGLEVSKQLQEMVDKAQIIEEKK